MGRVVSGRSRRGPQADDGNKTKPYWQPGWLTQHDRRTAGDVGRCPARVPLVISGDMHAIALGKMLRSGALDLKGNPIRDIALAGHDRDPARRLAIGR